MSTYGQGPRVDYTSKDYASLREAMLQLAREKLDGWTDHSPNDLGVVLLELFAYLGDILLYYQDRIADEGYLHTAVERRSVVNLLHLIGCELRPPRAASADLTLLFEEGAADEIAIQPGTEFETPAAITGEAVRFRYLGKDPLVRALADLKTTILKGKVLRVLGPLGEDPHARAGGLPVVQVDAGIEDEVVGSSDGTAGQRFALARAPLIDGTLVVEVDEGVGPVPWIRTASLLYSLASDPHYVVRRDEHDVAWVEFGDGKYGSVPRRGRNNVTADYLVGGGEKGNVPPRTITRAVTEIPGLHSVFNVRAASGGGERESIEEAVGRGPQLFRSMGRAVTARDYEAWAREFGVAKAQARAPGWNRVELFVAPAGGGYPSDTLKEDLRLCLEEKRMLTSMVEIEDPEYVGVEIEGTLEIEPLLIPEEVRQRIDRAVRELFAFERVDFEQTLYLSKVYEAIEAVEGVAYVHISRLARSDDDEPLPQNGKLELGWQEIPRLVGLELRAAE